MSEIKAALPTSKVVTIGEEEIKVEKLPLGQYAKLLMVLKDAPASIMTDLQNIEGKSNEESLQVMLGLFGNAWGQVLDIVSIGSGVERERLESDSTIGLDGGIALFMAIYEVNNLAGVFKSVKNQFSRQAK